tara:strand:- start:2153 stop:2347 length:195 start_codon:yes stop_codon:yes gene_type:complete
MNIKKQPILLVNPLNSEEWVCDDYQDTKYIDGIEYIKVRKSGQVKWFLMRKDALKKQVRYKAVT